MKLEAEVELVIDPQKTKVHQRNDETRNHQNFLSQVPCLCLHQLTFDLDALYLSIGLLACLPALVFYLSWGLLVVYWAAVVVIQLVVWAVVLLVFSATVVVTQWVVVVGVLAVSWATVLEIQLVVWMVVMLTVFWGTVALILLAVGVVVLRTEIDVS